MSIFNISRGVGGCQKGFLLIEALLALMIFGLFSCMVMGWYSQYLGVQRQTLNYLPALAAGSSFLGRQVARRAVPESGSYTEAGYLIELKVLPDKAVPNFYWLEARVAGLAGSLLSGVHSG